MVSIPEKLFLLSLYEKRNGSIQTNKSSLLPYGLIAGGLIQMILSGEGTINSSRKFVILNPATGYLSIPADLIHHILYEKDFRKCTFWIETLGRKRKKIEEEFLNHFVDRKILVLEGQVYRFSTEEDSTGKFNEKEEIRRQILGRGAISSETLAVVKLMNAVHLLDHLFTCDEIKPMHFHIDNLKMRVPQEEIVKQVDTDILGIVDSLNQVIGNEKE